MALGIVLLQDPTWRSFLIDEVPMQLGDWGFGHLVPHVDVRDVPQGVLTTSKGYLAHEKLYPP